MFVNILRLDIILTILQIIITDENQKVFFSLKLRRFKKNLITRIIEVENSIKFYNFNFAFNKGNLETKNEKNINFNSLHFKILLKTEAKFYRQINFQTKSSPPTKSYKIIHIVQNHTKVSKFICNFADLLIHL